MENIKTKGFIISDPGDTSVGIFPATWKLDGDFEFYDSDELNAFKKAITEAFEYVADPVHIATIEELDKQEEKFLAAFKKVELDK